MNVFDFIVTIALGSILATVMLNKSVPLAEGVLLFSCDIPAIRNNLLISKF
jgi:uncharacterized membrane protein YcaP (DUF421 family)